MQIYVKQNLKVLEGILETYLPANQRHKHDQEEGVGEGLGPKTTRRPHDRPDVR